MSVYVNKESLKNWAELDSNQRRRKASRFTVCPRWPLGYLPTLKNSQKALCSLSKFIKGHTINFLAIKNNKFYLNFPFSESTSSVFFGSLFSSSSSSSSPSSSIAFLKGFEINGLKKPYKRYPKKSIANIHL